MFSQNFVESNLLNAENSADSIGSEATSNTIPVPASLGDRGGRNAEDVSGCDCSGQRCTTVRSYCSFIVAQCFEIPN